MGSSRDELPGGEAHARGLRLGRADEAVRAPGDALAPPPDVPPPLESKGSSS